MADGSRATSTTPFPALPRKTELMQRADADVVSSVTNLRMRDVRLVYQQMRGASTGKRAAASVVVPEYGFTLGEFAMSTVLGQAAPRRAQVTGRR